jgi:hypothetical protein
MNRLFVILFVIFAIALPAIAADPCPTPACVAGSNVWFVRSFSSSSSAIAELAMWQTGDSALGILVTDVSGDVTSFLVLHREFVDFYMPNPNEAWQLETFADRWEAIAFYDDLALWTSVPRKLLELPDGRWAVAYKGATFTPPSICTDINCWISGGAR